MQKENTRKEFRDYILDELTRENIIRTDLKLISNHYKSQTRTTLEDKIYHKYLKTISSTLESYFLTRFGSWKGNILQYTQNYESWVKEALAHALIEALAEELTGTRSMLKNSQVHFSSYMKSFHENLDSKMKEVFNLPLPNRNGMSSFQRSANRISLSGRLLIFTLICWDLFSLCFYFANG